MIADKLEGTEAFGDRKDKRYPWAIKFDDLDFTHFIVESLDKQKSYMKEYKKEELVGNMKKDEVLNYVNKMADRGGVAVYIKNKIQKRQIKNLYINENNLSQYKAKKIYEEIKGDDTDLYVDSFEKIGQLKEDKLKRTLWFGPIADHFASYSRQDVINQIF